MVTQMPKHNRSLLANFVEDYVQVVMDGFEQRWNQIRPEIYEKYIHECIGGLLSRQATLSIEMARAPSIWNGHVAPLILRCQIEAYITLSWIVDDPRTRANRYIKYGLGQEKLSIGYLEEALAEEPHTIDSNRVSENISVRKSWLNSQLAEWATEVDVGSWSGISTREMAREIGRESIYKHAYVPFSGPTHNMWQHVGRYNTVPCENPLHKWHLVPKILKAPLDPDFMYRSAKYVTLTYQAFDTKLNVQCDVPLPEVYFVEHPLFSSDEDREEDRQ